MVRKSIIFVLMLFFATTFIYQVSTYTSAEINSQAQVAVVESEHGLIAVPSELSFTVTQGEEVTHRVPISNNTSHIVEANWYFTGEFDGVTISAPETFVLTNGDSSQHQVTITAANDAAPGIQWGTARATAKGDHFYADITVPVKTKILRSIPNYVHIAVTSPITVTKGETVALIVTVTNELPDTVSVFPLTGDSTASRSISANSEGQLLYQVDTDSLNIGMHTIALNARVIWGRRSCDIATSCVLTVLQPSTEVEADSSIACNDDTTD